MRASFIILGAPTLGLKEHMSRVSSHQIPELQALFHHSLI